MPLFIDSKTPALTRVGKTGKVYVRREFVSKQIESLKGMDDKELLRRVKVRQEEEQDSLKSETLIYIFRSLRSRPEEPIFPIVENEISTTLFERIARIVSPFRLHFLEDPNLADNFVEFRLNVVLKLYEKICVPGTNDADFAEVSFGQFIVGLARNEIKKYFRDKKLFSKFLNIEDTINKMVLFSKDVQITDSILSEVPIQDRAALLRDALTTLPEPKRTAWVLRYAEDWPIEDKDPHVPTLSKYFKVSGRTIRNWLSDAESELAERRANTE
jgi:DNA-directed RNA polymerase specialized sigma24 family protein